MFSGVRTQENYIESLSSRSKHDGNTAGTGSDSARKVFQSPFANLGP